MSLIYVVGSRGLMGKRVLQLLQDELPRDQIVPLTRKEPIHSQRHVDLHHPDALELQPGDVVVNAVGLHPLQVNPYPMITHCLRSGAHYIDLAESLDIHELGRQAVTAFTAEGTPRSAVVQGCSTIPAMVDVLLPAAGGTERTVLLSVGLKNEISVSLMYGLLRPLGRHHASGRWWTETTSRRLFDGSLRRYGSHPGSWTDGTTQFFCGFDRRFAYWVLRAGLALTSRMSDDALVALCKAALPLAFPGGQVVGTPRGSLRFEQHRSRHLTETVEVRAERDGLLVPSLPAVWAARELVGRRDVAGLTNLGELIDRDAIVDELQRRGYEVEHRLEASELTYT